MCGRECVLAGQPDGDKRLIDNGIHAYDCLRNLRKLIHCKFYEFVKSNVGEILGLADGLSVGAKVLTLCSA